MKHEVRSPHMPPAAGPYSQAIRTGSLLLCSGQIGTDPKTGNLVEGGVHEQMKQVIENIRVVLEAAGSSLDGVVKTTVFLQHMDDFAAMNELYGSVFTKPYPARSTIEVAKLPKGALIEIECIARIKKEERCCGGGGSDCHCQGEDASQKGA